MGATRRSWPLGRGFDRWYGFHGGETQQFVPALYHDNHAVRPTRFVDDDYHLSADLADRAIEFVGDLRAVDADQPFFLYLATGACHSPTRPRPSGSTRYRGQFDGGWDEWRARAHARQLATGVLPPGTAPLAPSAVGPGLGRPRRAQRHRGARFMECFAAFLSYTDHQLGRVHGVPGRPRRAGRHPRGPGLGQRGQRRGRADGSINDIRLENFDPAGPEEMYARMDEIGGPSTHNNYPWGWTMAGNTPFKRWKREVHQGGVADPCIVRWPAPPAGGRRWGAPSVHPRHRRHAHRARAGRGRAARR